MPDAIPAELCGIWESRLPAPRRPLVSGSTLAEVLALEERYRTGRA